MRYLSVCIVCLLMQSALRAQFPHTRTIEIRSGQERPSIKRFAQDQDGSLWLGTEIGLLRTDGERVETRLRLEGVTITAMSTAGDELLIAMDDGTILRCGIDRCDTIFTDDVLVERQVNDLLIDSSGVLWIATHGGGIIRFDRNSGRTDQVSGLRDEHVNGLGLLPDGTVVAATDQGLSLCDGAQVTRTLGEQDGAPDNLILCVTTTSNGTIWAGTDRSGAFSWDPRSGNISIPDTAWQHGKITAISVIDDVVWLGTRNGAVIVHEREQRSTYERIPETGRDMIHDMLIDRYGAVWWCNGTDRLYRSDAAILFVDDHEGVDMRNAGALCADGEGRIWFATSEGLFHHPVGFAGHQQLTRVPVRIDQRTPIVSLEAAEDGSIWAGTFGGGAIRVDPGDAIAYFNSTNSALSDNVLSVKASGGSVWFATLEGLCRYDDSGFTRFALPSPGFVFDVLPLDDGSTLAATDGNGVLQLLPDGSWRSLLGGEGRFYSLVDAGRNGAWAAGPGTGFCKVTSDRECHHAAMRPFDSDLFALAQLDRHLIAFGSSATLVHDLRSGQATDATARLGLENIQVELNAVDKDMDGSLWLATDRGLLRMRPKEWHFSDRITTSISAFRSGGVLLDRNKEIALPYDHDRLSVEFTAIHWVDPGAVRFQYRLLPNDQRGQVTRDRQIYFSALPPGEYELQIRSFIGDVPSDEEWTSIQFKVTAPLWQRPWVIALSAALLLSIVVLVMRARDRRLRERERMEQEKVRFQLEALRSQVDPHFLFNSFNTLMELIETEPSRAVQHVDKLSLFFRNILLVRDKELITLDEELRLLENYFALEQHRFGKAIELDVQVDRRDREMFIVPLALQLLVENSLKHNVATQQEPLRIDVRSVAGQVIVSNPIHARITAPRSTGFGLESIRKRYAAFTHREITVNRENDRFTVHIPLIEADESIADRR